MEFIVFGVNHHIAPLEIRESLALSEDEIELVLQGVKEKTFFREGFILSTCNRTEFYVLCTSAVEAEQEIRLLVRQIKETDTLDKEEHAFRLLDRDAVGHLFRVSSGLDSMVLGEPQIFGQVKKAYSVACQARTSGAFVNKLCHLAFRVAKRSRSETAIGKGAVSIAWAAVGKILSRFGSLEGRKGLLIGAGSHGELVARHLLSNKIESLFVTNRTAERAEQLVEKLGGSAFPVERLPEMIAEVDVAVCCTSSLNYVIDTSILGTGLEMRRGRPLVIIDIAVPRDVDPHLGKLGDVELYDIDGLTAVVDENLAARQAAVPLVEELVKHEEAKFFAWYRSLQTVPVLQALLRKAEGIRQNELETMKRRLDEKDLKRLDNFSRRLVSRLFNDTVSRIKLCDRGTRMGLLKLDTISDLFDLDVEGFGANRSKTEGESSE